MLFQRPRDDLLERMVESTHQDVRPRGCISMHGNHRIALGNEIEDARLVEAAARQMEAIEIVAAGPHALKEVQAVVVARDGGLIAAMKKS